MDIIIIGLLIAVFVNVLRISRDIIRIKKKLGMDRDTNEEPWSFWNLVR